uniref:Uncharacterized protein n=1 Tax=Magallana gigas TaxID=29159 RepID=K1RGE6_MAGGI
MAPAMKLQRFEVMIFLMVVFQIVTVDGMMEGSGGFFLPNTGMGSLQEILPETDRPAEDFPMNRSTQICGCIYNTLPSRQIMRGSREGGDGSRLL